MSLENGCEVIVNTCMSISENDKVVIVTDNESKKIADCIREKVLDITPDTRYFNLDIYGERPLNRLPDTIDKKATEATVTFFVAKTIKGELDTVRMPFFNAGVNGGRHAHMMNITEEIVEKGIDVDYERVEEFTQKVHSVAKKATDMRIKTDKGTDLSVEVGRFKWVAATGISKQAGDWLNLPDGEVYTAPDTMDGTVVADGTMGDYFDGMFSLDEIENAELTLTIKTFDRPKVVDIDCKDTELKEEFTQYVNEYECSQIVGEVGLGTNIFLEELIGNILMDEKHPTAHIAFGDPNDNMTFAGWKCPKHVDLVLQDCDIWLDDEMIMEKGTYLI